MIYDTERNKRKNKKKVKQKESCMHKEIRQINYLLDKRLMLNDNQIQLFRIF
jgi:hypothetical protein